MKTMELKWDKKSPCPKFVGITLAYKYLQAFFRPRIIFLSGSHGQGVSCDII